jgi:hypothetical protein
MIRTIPLPPQERLRELFDYDPSTGKLTWRGKASRKHHPGMEAGSVHKSGARQVMIEGVLYLVHRLIWKWLHDEEPPEVDHHDNDPGNNREINLRAADRPRNGRNTRKQRGKPLPKGVYRNRSGKFIAQIKRDGVHHYLGVHTDPQVAHEAYVVKAKELFGEFANNGAGPCL